MLPRCVVSNTKGKVSLRGFADASKLAICAAVYILVTYPDAKREQSLLVANHALHQRKCSQIV